MGPTKESWLQGDDVAVITSGLLSLYRVLQVSELALRHGLTEYRFAFSLSLCFWSLSLRLRARLITKITLV